MTPEVTLMPTYPRDRFAYSSPFTRKPLRLPPGPLVGVVGVEIPRRGVAAGTPGANAPFSGVSHHPTPNRAPVRPAGGTAGARSGGENERPAGGLRSGDGFV